MSDLFPTMLYVESTKVHRVPCALTQAERNLMHTMEIGNVTEIEQAITQAATHGVDDALITSARVRLLRVFLASQDAVCIEQPVKCMTF